MEIISEILKTPPEQWYRMKAWGEIRERALHPKEVWRRRYGMPPNDPRYLQADDMMILEDMANYEVYEKVMSGVVRVPMSHSQDKSVKEFDKLVEMKEKAMKGEDENGEWNEYVDGIQDYWKKVLFGGKGGDEEVDKKKPEHNRGDVFLSEQERERMRKIRKKRDEQNNNK